MCCFTWQEISFLLNFDTFSLHKLKPCEKFFWEKRHVLQQFVYFSLISRGGGGGVGAGGKGGGGVW